MKKLLFAGVSLVALGVSLGAQAADMPLKAPPLPLWTWTGAYIGVHVGGGLGSRTRGK